MATLQTKEDKVVENMTATPEIDINVKIDIPRSAIPFDEKKHKFKCSACGRGFSKQNGYFQKSNDVLLSFKLRALFNALRANFFSFLKQAHNATNAYDK